MRIFLVAGADQTWHNTGYGASLLAGDANRILVSFVEYIKNPDLRMALKAPEGPYQPIINRDKRAIDEVKRGILPMFEHHHDELFDKEEAE